MESLPRVRELGKRQVKCLQQNGYPRELDRSTAGYPFPMNESDFNQKQYLSEVYSIFLPKPHCKGNYETEQLNKPKR